MLKVKFVLMLTAATVLSSCGQSTNQVGTPSSEKAEVIKPTIDTSTPDKALKSYWAALDARRAEHAEFAKAHSKEIATFSAQLPQVMTPTLAGMYKDDTSDPDTFSRDIVKVEMETESRAIIIAKVKNTSPIPQGAKPLSADDIERRMEGEPAKYVVEKEKDGWRVAEVWEWDTYPRPDWRKERPVEVKPRYPTYTMYGR